MAAVATKEQVEQEAAIFNEAWRILKKYYNITQHSADEEWEALINETNKLYKMPTPIGEKSKLSKSIALAVVEHIELLSREREQNI